MARPPPNWKSQDFSLTADSGIVPGEELSRQEDVSIEHEEPELPSSAADNLSQDTDDASPLASNNSHGVQYAESMSVSPSVPSLPVLSNLQDSDDAVTPDITHAYPTEETVGMEASSLMYASHTTHTPSSPPATPITASQASSAFVTHTTHVPQSTPSLPTYVTTTEVNYLNAQLAEKNMEIEELKKEKEKLIHKNEKVEQELHLERIHSRQQLLHTLNHAREIEESKGRKIKELEQRIASLEQKRVSIKEKLDENSVLTGIGNLQLPVSNPFQSENPFQHVGVTEWEEQAQIKAKHIKILEQLLNSKTTIDIRYLKLFLIGPPFVGKTTTRDRLLKIIINIAQAEKNPDYNPDSTLLANCNQVLASINKDEWLFSKNIEEEAQLVFGLIKQVVKFDDTQEDSPDTVNTQLFSDKLTQAPIQETSQLDSKVVAVINRLKALVSSGDYTKFQKLLGSTLLNIYDIGGQPGFLEMLPALIRGPAMYLLCFKMSHDLHKPFPIRFSRHKMHAEITPYSSEHSVVATISQIISSIASIQCASAPFESRTLRERFEKLSQICPAAAFIGTFKDEVVQDYEEKIKTISQALDSLIRVFQKSNITIFGCKDNFFPLDNKNGTDSEDMVPLRSSLTQLFRTHFKHASLPIHPSWLLFGIVLRNEYSIAKMSDCIKIGEALHMEKDEVKACLWYLHYCVGTLLYYPDLEDDWFKNNVICSPQVVFDSISQLVLASLRILHSNEPLDLLAKIDWIEKGQFSVKLIETFCSEAVEEDLRNLKLIPIEKLIKLLEHVKLLSPIYHPSEVGSLRQDQVMYFMPAILECIPQDKLPISPKPDANNPEPLFITFKCGYVPTGVFCRLIACLVSSGPKKILGLIWELKQKDTLVKRNCISFLVENSNVVTLLCHEKYYEIRVVRELQESSLHDLCTYVLSAILYTLKCLYPRIAPIIAFKCPCPDHRDHDVGKLCSIKNDFWCQFTCEEKCKQVTLRRYQEIWIGKHVVHGVCTELEVLKYAGELGFTFSWTKKGPKPLKRTNNENTLIFTTIGEEDLGYYQCEVKENKTVVLTIIRALYTVKSTGPPQKEPKVAKKTVDCEIEQHDIAFIAGHFDNVEYYLDVFKLTFAEKTDVRNLIPQGTEIAMIKCLTTWRKHNPETATFKLLLDILRKLKKEEIEYRIMEYLKNTEYNS